MVIATGFFDGVHLGHRYIITQLLELAKQRGEKSMVITFWPHPRNVLQNEARSLRLLTSKIEKINLLKSLGVDEVVCIDFTKDFSGFSTQEYLEKYIIEKYNGTAILLGYDNRMGCDGKDTQSVARQAKALGLDVFIADRYLSEENEIISSTKIRNLISEGNIEKANNFLGYNYSLYGVVVSGNQLGRTIGFPTANMQLYEPLKILPSCGVYLVKVQTLGKIYWGMCYIGYRPTIASGLALTIETNIFDFHEDIYGLDLRLEFVNRIRSDIKFDNIDGLKRQLDTDKRECISLIPNIIK